MHNNININVSGPIQPASTYKTKVLKGNQSFASQVTEPNMKYVIRHNFDLRGETVTIPDNCILEFDGGSLSNGLCYCNLCLLTGDYVASVNSLYGTAKDINGEVLSFNYKRIQNISSYLLTSTSNKPDSFALNYAAAAVVCDERYIYQLAQKTNTSSLLALFEIDGNYKGLIEILPAGHCNTITEKDGYLYISHSGNSESSIYRLSSQDVVDAVNNSAESIQMVQVSTDYAAQAISYDYGTRRFYIYDVTRSKLCICDDNFNLLEEKDNPFNLCTTYLNNKGINGRCYYNEFFVKNGICVVCGGWKNDGDLNFIAPLFFVDVYSGTVTGYILNDDIIHKNEVEGISLYKGNQILLTQFNNRADISRLYKSSRGFSLYKLTIDFDIVEKPIGKGFVSVDKDFIGISIGTESNPYQSIYDALTNISPDSYDTVIVLEPNLYNLKHQMLDNRTINMEMKDYEEGQEHSVVLPNDIKNANLYFKNFATQISSDPLITYTNCKVRFDSIDYNHNITAYNSDFYIKGGTFLNTRNLNASNCRFFIEDITSFFSTAHFYNCEVWIKNSTIEEQISFENCIVHIEDCIGTNPNGSYVFETYGTSITIQSCTFTKSVSYSEEQSLLQGSSTVLRMTECTITDMVVINQSGKVGSFVTNDIINDNTIVYNNARSLIGGNIFRVIKTRVSSAAELTKVLEVLRSESSATIRKMVDFNAARTHYVNNDSNLKQYVPKGVFYYDKENDRFVDDSFQVAWGKSGASTGRPKDGMLNLDDIGKMFFDKTLGKPIFLNVTDNGEGTNPRYTCFWVDEKGFTATVTKGTTRPTGTGGGGVLNATRDIGFEFFDTNPSVMKPIYASAIANDGTVTWVDATGATV